MLQIPDVNAKQFMSQDNIKHIDFHIGQESFPTYITDDDLGGLITILQKHPATSGFDKLLVGFDSNSAPVVFGQIEKIFKERKIAYEPCMVSHGENNKSLESLQKILDCFFLQINGTRKTIVFALGGGIVSNIFGLAASIIFRGIRLVHMPTTFLNAHDAAGSSQKQAINYAGRKNVIGTYYLPTLVLHATRFYQTLDDKEIKSGFGELVKNAFIFGGDHLGFIEDSIQKYDIRELKRESLLLKKGLYLGLRAKQQLLAKDPKEKGDAIIFEFGHTLGHAFEMVFENTTHGECVAMGCYASAYISREMGLLSKMDYERISGIVEKLNPEMKYPKNRTLESLNYLVLSKVRSDNKRGYLPEMDGHIPMVLLRAIGEIHKPNRFCLEYVPERLVESACMNAIRKFAVG